MARPMRTRAYDVAKHLTIQEAVIVCRTARDVVEQFDAMRDNPTAPNVAYFTRSMDELRGILLPADATLAAAADTGQDTTENPGSAEGGLHELWVVQSETHLQDGALAYWGPYAVEEEAHKMLNTCAHGALIYIPKPLVPANHT